MAKKINITNFEELNSYLQKWVWKKFRRKTKKAEFLNKSGNVHFMMCFLDMLEGYAIPNLEPEYEADTEEGMFSPENNIVFRYFNEGHTLEELSYEVFLLDGLEELDPFGFYSYQETWEVAVMAIQEFYKEVK